MSTTKWATAQVKSLDNRRIEFVASHERVDRDSEVVIVAGIDLIEFLINPILCLQHDTRKTAVARVENLRRARIDGAMALIGNAVFPDRPASNDALADVKAGLLNSVSIGFRVLERGGPILPDQHGQTFLKTSLLEISLVTLPACATCVVTSKSAGGCRCSEQNALDGLLIVGDEIVFDEDLTRMVRTAARQSMRQVIHDETRRAVNYYRGRIDD
ncbi:MAG: HK97 family phage prohead protease [Nitrospira sp.]|nr:HK97 family phage prohead protease [Nitrospira sp.]